MTRWQSGGWLGGIEHRPSPNFGVRPPGAVVDLVVIHAISLPPGRFGGGYVERFFENRLPVGEHPYFASIAGLAVSAHFFIRRDGSLVQLVGGDDRAWHAGRSAWAGRENCNDYSLGIELEGDDEQTFAAAQYDTLLGLLAALRRRYPLQAVVGHCHIAPERKTDPGPCFDWERLAACGLELPRAGLGEKAV